MIGESNQLFFNTPAAQAYASASPNVFTIFAQWTILIKPSVALKYANEFDKLSNTGFARHEGRIVLTHQDAKLTLDEQEASAIIQLILSAYGPKGLYPQ